MTDIPIKIQFVKSLSNLKPSRMIAVKADGDTTFTLYVTDKNSAPYPLKDLTGSGGITNVSNTDGNLVITGLNNKVINISPTLLATIASALQSGDNISSLVNDAGYLTTFTETDPIFQASEASLFVAGDKTNLDNQSGINTGDETTSSIQTKRPLKTINNDSLEGTGNIQIDYNDLSNIPITFTPSTHTHVEADIIDLDKYTQLEVDNLLDGKFDNPAGNNTQYLDGAGVPTTFPTIPSGATNLGYTASPTNGVVTSDTGTDAIIPIADFNNAGLLTSEEKQLLYNNSATGITKFEGFSINVDTTKYNTGVIEGWFVDNTTNPNIPTKVFKSFPATIGNTLINIAIQNVTYIAIDINGVHKQSGVPFEPENQRDWIPLGVIVHSNRISINAINNQPVVALSPNNQLSDLMESIGFFNVTGNVFSANGVNLSINKSAGHVFKQGSNYINNIKDPHTLSLPALVSPSNIRYRTQTGAETGDTNIISPNFWDNGGVITAMTGTRWSIQRIYIFQSNLVRIQYGQDTYENLAEAIQAISTEAFVVEQNILENGLFRGLLIVRRNATDLTDLARALFIEASKFGSVAGLGSLSTTSLQQAYLNSVTPEISTVNGAVTIKQASGSDTDNVLETQNGVGVTKFQVTGEGNVSGNNLSGTNTGDETLSSITTKLDLHSGSVNIDFGISGDFLKTTVNALWVTALHQGKIKCEVFDDEVDHLFGEALLGNLTASIGNIIAGVSFDVVITSQHDTWGRYIVKYNEII